MNNKSIILAGGVTVIGLFLAVSLWILSPKWVPLFPGTISDSSQQSALLLLSQKNIQYELDSSKGLILVKSSDLGAAQLMLADNGLPEEHVAGLEVFNSSDYGLSEFAQTINYQRGMEEELARTIKKLKDIKDARVHLTIKKDSLFEERKQPPKASVVVTPHANQVLTSQVVVGIQEIVAAALPNMEPKQVVIVTNSGNVLSSTTDHPGQSSQGIEEKYIKLVSGLLAAIMGEGQYKVSVNVVIDNKKKVTVQESFFPDVNTGKGFSTRRKTSEKSTLNGSSIEEAPQTQKTNEEEFVYSKERSETVFPSGEITKITVGIVITKSISDADKENITKLIFNSLGMIETRGDKVSLFASQSIEKSAPHELSNPSVAAAPVTSTNTAVEDPLVRRAHLISYALTAVLVAFFLLLIAYLRAYKRNQVVISDDELKKLSSELKNWLHSS